MIDQEITGGSRVFGYPALHSATLDYENPNAYQTEIDYKPNKHTAYITHSMDADSLVFHLVKEGLAFLACVESLPDLIHRKIHYINQESYNRHERTIKCFQEISIFGNNERKHFYAFHLWPIIVLKDALELRPQGQGEGVLDSNNPDYGLKGLHKGGSFSLPEGAILAYGNWHSSDSSLGLFVIRENNNYPEDAFRVEGPTQEEGIFQIVVSVNPLLRREINSNDSKKNHILCCALTQIFMKLSCEKSNKLEIGEEGQQDSVSDIAFWDAIENKIKQQLTSKEQKNLREVLRDLTLQKAAQEMGEEFPASYVASLLYRVVSSDE